MSLNSYKTPLRYPGGKSRACKKMEPFFPDLRDYDVYYEPFLGGGSVALHITKKYPKLQKLRDYFLNIDKNSYVRMSGSGSTIVGYFKSKKAALNAKKLLKKKYKNYWCNLSKTI